MARQEQILSVFVASPSDVQSERETLEEVIRELNFTWSRELGIRLDLVRWETHTYPAFGDDAQAVINEQIDDDYDIFIGIMWCRYGTPTGRSGSGTVEEFERAKKRFDEDKNSVHLMVYFKDEAVPPSKLDLEQLSKVNNFRKSLGEEGGLYWQFDSLESFEQLIRIHLSRQVQAWKSKPVISTESLKPQKQTNESVEFDDDGIFDLMEVFEDKFEELTEITKRIATATQQIGGNMSKRTAEMESLERDSDGNANRKEAKQLISLAASDLNDYAASIDVELPLFNDAMNIGMNSFIKAVNLSTDVENDIEEIEAGLEAIISLRGNITDAKKSITGFRETIANLPRMTTVLNKAKRKVLNSMDNLLNEYSNGEKLQIESEKAINELLNSIS